MADDPKSTVIVDGDSSGAQGEIQSLSGMFGGLFGVIGGAAAAGFGLGAISGALDAIGDAITAPYRMLKDFVTSAADAGDKMYTMSKQTGLSVQALSTFKYISDQTGASLDAIGNNAFKMSINIAKGGKSVEGAFKAIGTSSKELRELEPEQQFAKIMEGLGGIPDAGQRALVGTQIFGKGFREIAQLADEDLAALTDNAKTFGLVMSDEMAAAGDAFGDTLSDISSLFQGLKNIIGAAVLPIVTDFLGVIRDELVVAFKMLKDAIGPFLGGLDSMKDKTDEYIKSGEFHDLILRTIIKTVAYTTKAFAELIKASIDIVTAWYDLRIAGNFLLLLFGKLVEGALWSAKQISDGMAKISFGDMRKSFERDSAELSGKLEEVRADIKNLGDATQDLFVEKMQKSAAMVNFANTLSTVSDGLIKQANAYHSAGTAAAETKPKVKGLGDDIEGLGDKSTKTKDKIDEFANTASKQIALLRQAWYQETPAIRENTESIGILLDKYMALRAKVTDPSKLPNDLEALAYQFGKLHGPMLGTQKDLDAILNSLPKVGYGLAPSLQLAELELDKVGEKTFFWGEKTAEAAAQAEEARKKARQLALEGLDRLAASLQQIQQIAPGALGTVASAIGTVIGVSKTAKGAIDDIKNAAKAAGAGETLAAIGSIASGIGGIISAATVAIGLFKKLFGAEGRKTVESFAAEHGGFDALHNELLTLGDAGEALWIKLTQGVGRNNPEQARAVIEEITRALEAQKAKQDEVTDVTEETAAATIETATQASQALDLVKQKLNDNKPEWQSWGEVVNGVINGIGDNLRSVAALVASLPTGSLNASVNVNNGIRASGGGNSITIQEGAINVDRPILKDRESMQELTAGIAGQFRTVLGTQGLW